MEIQIDRRSPVPIYLQITNGIKEMILKKKLPGGFRLPPERRLARSLGINRSTVLNAYRELKADGLVDAHVGQGTTVVPQGQTLNDPETVQPLPWRQLIRDSGSRNQDPLIRDLLELTEQRDVISLSIGLPAPELLPLQILRDIQDRLVAELGAAVLLHSPTEGITSFRETLCQQMTIRGIRCSLSDVLVTSRWKATERGSTVGSKTIKPDPSVSSWLTTSPYIRLSSGTFYRVTNATQLKRCSII